MKWFSFDDIILINIRFGIHNRICVITAFNFLFGIKISGLIKEINYIILYRYIIKHTI